MDERFSCCESINRAPHVALSTHMVQCAVEISVWGGVGFASAHVQVISASGVSGHKNCWVPLIGHEERHSPVAGCLLQLSTQREKPTCQTRTALQDQPARWTMYNCTEGWVITKPTMDRGWSRLPSARDRVYGRRLHMQGKRKSMCGRRG